MLATQVSRMEKSQAESAKDEWKRVENVDSRLTQVSISTKQAAMNNEEQTRDHGKDLSSKSNYPKVMDSDHGRLMIPPDKTLTLIYASLANLSRTFHPLNILQDSCVRRQL